MFDVENSTLQEMEKINEGWTMIVDLNKDPYLVKMAVCGTCKNGCKGSCKTTCRNSVTGKRRN